MSSDVVIEIEQSKLNIPTIKINNYYIHSKYNPIKEAEQFALKNYQKGNFHILFGNGLGYYTEAFGNISINKEDFVVYEPAEKVPYIGELNIQKDFELFKKVISEKIKLYENVNVIVIPNYLKLFPEEYKNILSYTQEQMLIAKIYENTMERFSNEWQENYIKNLKFIKKDFSIHKLNNKYSNPVIVASAGPSLGKQIPFLKEMREKYILVASGSAITALMKYDLEPDFIVTMDGGIANAQHFEKVKTNKARLVYSLVTHHNVRGNFEGLACHYLSTDCYEMEPHYNKITNMKALKLLGGASVATYALSFARYISDGPITLVGQDLAYTNNSSHDAENNNSYNITEEYKKKHGLFETIGYKGEKVFTDYTFLAMREAFEIVIKKLELSEDIFNSTEGGLSIKGIEELTLLSFFGKYLKDGRKLDLEGDFEGNYIDGTNILRVLQKELINYDKGIQLLNENLKLLNSSRNSRTFKQSILVKLDNNEKDLLKISEHLPIVIAVKKIVIKILKSAEIKESETEYMKFKRIYEKNDKFYTDLLVIFKEARFQTEQLIINEMENKL